MQAYSYGAPNTGFGEPKKTYVFVDEHNRHKRLKVMRACEGCRKRKIKCDSATTNSWPCSACVRLKVQCSPPSINQDRSQYNTGPTAGLEKVLDFDQVSGDEEYDDTNSDLEYAAATDHMHQHNVYHNYDYPSGGLTTPPYGQAPRSEYSYRDVAPVRMDTPFQNHTLIPTASGTDIQLPQTDGSWNTERYTGIELSEIMGDLKIDENGVAPYISQQRRMLAEAPAFEEIEMKLPPNTGGEDAPVKIPDELMPSEEQCLHWFQIFFDHVHPYVPVISKSYFYEQWRANRRSISPLVLEAIFACAARMSDDPTQGSQWLALSSKHEEYFQDTARISTVQAMLILLKARETSPKRGYYYRSWMAIKGILNMAKDLGLQHHYTDHSAGLPCESSDAIDCLVKTRTWQMIFVLEMMIGGPQGRFDMEVQPYSVDFNNLRPMLGIDGADYQISRAATYFVRLVRNVRQMNDVYGSIRRQKGWAGDQKFLELNHITPKWLEELPRDLQVTFPEDGTPPWLPSHYVGNMHCYYYLNNIMLHRPQLVHTQSFVAGGSWREHMVKCYSSAKAICRLQEAIQNSFGLTGLLYMQRGSGFVVYTVLTCTMIHLVAITSPDPDFNLDARDYFTRHMRILEAITSRMPMPELQAQIDALREAFSADTSRPFELRANFPYTSPTPVPHDSPHSHASFSSQHSQQSHPSNNAHNSHLTQRNQHPDVKYEHKSLSRQHSHEQPAHTIYPAQSMTPPISAGLGTFKDQDYVTSFPLVTNGQQQPTELAPVSAPDSNGEVLWNPTPIFAQWNSAFPPAAGDAQTHLGFSGQSSPPFQSAAPVAAGMSDLDETVGHPQPPPQAQPQAPNEQYTIPAGIPPMASVNAMPQATLTNTAPTFVTSSMWRDTVADTYDPGRLKRQWEQDSNQMVETFYPTKRMK